MCYFGPVKLFCQSCDRDMGRRPRGITYCDAIAEGREEDCNGAEDTDQEIISRRGHNCIFCQEEVVVRTRAERRRRDEEEDRRREAENEAQRRENQRQLEEYRRQGERFLERRRRQDEGMPNGYH